MGKIRSAAEAKKAENEKKKRKRDESFTKDYINK